MLENLKSIHGELKKREKIYLYKTYICLLAWMFGPKKVLYGDYPGHMTVQALEPTAPDLALTPGMARLQPVADGGQGKCFLGPGRPGRAREKLRGHALSSDVYAIVSKPEMQSPNTSQLTSTQSVPPIVLPQISVCPACLTHAARPFTKCQRITQRCTRSQDIVHINIQYFIAYRLVWYIFLSTVYQIIQCGVTHYSRSESSSGLRSESTGTPNWSCLGLLSTFGSVPSRESAHRGEASRWSCFQCPPSRSGCVGSPVLVRVWVGSTWQRLVTRLSMPCRQSFLVQQCIRDLKGSQTIFQTKKHMSQLAFVELISFNNWRTLSKVKLHITVLRPSFRPSDESIFQIVQKGRNFKNFEQGYAQSFCTLSDRIFCMKNLRKPLPGPYPVEK